MIYFNLIPAVLVIGAYFLGHYVGRRSRDIHFTQMVAQNAKLKTMLDFVQAENEHVAGMFKDRVAMADNPLRSVKCPEWPILQAKLANELKWCEHHRQYDLCHLS